MYISVHTIRGQLFFKLRPNTSLSAGRTTLGYGEVDISIQGPGVAAQHCYIENRSGVITLHPSGNLCAVDGLQVQKPTLLSQGRNLITKQDSVHAVLLVINLLSFPSGKANPAYDPNDG